MAWSDEAREAAAEARKAGAKAEKSGKLDDHDEASRLYSVASGHHPSGSDDRKKLFDKAQEHKDEANKKRDETKLPKKPKLTGLVDYGNARKAAEASETRAYASGRKSDFAHAEKAHKLAGELASKPSDVAFHREKAAEHRQNKNEY